MSSSRCFFNATKEAEMSLLFNLDDTAVVEKVTMKWPSDDYFIPAGTPMSREGIANDENAVGVLASPAKVEFTFPDSIARLIGKKEPKGTLDYTFDIITAGFVDIKKAEASFGGKIEPAAKSAMTCIRFIESASDLGGDYFEIIIDWDAMTCNYSASEIREASDEGKPFIGMYDFDSFNEENNTATIIEWKPNYGNSKYEYIVHEDKTVDEIPTLGRLLNDMPLRVSMGQQGYVISTANQLHEEYYDADLQNFPLIYLYDDDGNVYHLAYYQGKTGSSDAVMRFVCVTSTSIKYAELSGDNTHAYITEKAI